MDSVEPDSHRIGKRSVKGVILADRQQLPESIAGITETWDGVQNHREQRLLPKVFLNHVIDMQTVLLSQLDINVAGSLIQRDVGYCTAGKTGEIGRRR